MYLGKKLHVYTFEQYNSMNKIEKIKNTKDHKGCILYTILFCMKYHVITVQPKARSFWHLRLPQKTSLTFITICSHVSRETTQTVSFSNVTVTVLRTRNGTVLSVEAWYGTIYQRNAQFVRRKLFLSGKEQIT